MKVFLCILLTLIIHLISVNSYSVMTFGKYAKDYFDYRNSRLNNAFNFAQNKIVERIGEPVEVFPVGIYRQIVNGINYKIITAVKDLKHKKVELLNSIIYSEPFINPTSSDPKFAYEEKIDNEFKTYQENDQMVLDHLENFLYDQLDATHSALERVKSIETSPGVVDNEFFYLINCDVIQDGRSINRYLLISLDKKGLNVVQTIDFANN